MRAPKLFWAAIAVAMAALVTSAGCQSETPPAVEEPLLLAPESLSAEPGDAECTVQWSAVPNALSYNLYWANSPMSGKSQGTKVAGARSPFVHKGLNNGKDYYYFVTAVYAKGESAESSQVSAMPVAPVPGKPGSVIAVPGDGAALVNWSPVSGAVTYNLYWSLSAGVVPGGAGVTAVTGLTGTSYTHSGLANGTTYFYVVTAVNTGGEGLPSAEATATPQPPAPGAPANLAATPKDAESVLAWSPVAAATSYSLYWSLSAGVVPGGAGVTAVTGLTGTSYTHSGLVNGTTYYYVVSAVGPGGESAPSGEVSARPLPPAPPAPLGVTAIVSREEAGQSVLIQWYDSPGATGYNLYRGNSPGLAGYYQDPAKATRIDNVTAPYVDTNVVSGTTYYYVVTAFVPLVEGPPSGEVSATIGSGGGGGGGGEDTSFGNNLSFPLVFADGYGIGGLKIGGTWPGTGPFAALPTFDFNTGLRPLSTEALTTFPFLDPSTAVQIGGVTYYPQATASTWQAEWRSNSAGATLEVIVDWGDALLSKTYTVNSIIRVETVLKQDSTIAGVTDQMTGYTMKLLSGSQATELQGTTGTTYLTDVRNVFAVNARLKIEKITGTGTDVVVFDKSVAESFALADGSGEKGYGGELNVGGSLVYGYNFQLNKAALPSGTSKTGSWRFTFSLDPSATIGTANVQNHIHMIGKADAGATLAPDGLSSSVVVQVN